MTAWRGYLAVGAGSALGASLRYLVSLAFWSTGFPWATLTVNVLGSWLVAAFVAFASGCASGRVASWQPFLVVGFCGGFTTFSLFSLETLQLLDQGHPWLALGYVLVSVLLWLTAAWHGYHTGHRVGMTRG